MFRTSHLLHVAAVLAVLIPNVAAAQSAGSSSSGSSPSGGVGSGNSPSPATPAPSGGVPTGKSAIGAETPMEVQQQQKMKKDTTICKGC